MMKNALYGGVNAAVLTAMHADLSVDLDRMARHCQWLLANGCNGLAVLGTTGEGNSLGIAERLSLLEGLVERGVPATVMMPGTGTTALTDTVLLTRRAEELGCRGALLLPPFFYKDPTDDGLFAWFSEVIQRVGGDIRIYLYHFPAQSAVPFSLDLVGRLLRAWPGKVKGIKDSTGDFAATRAYVEAYAGDGFEVYCGDDSALQALLRQGGAGSITAAANVGSALSALVYRNWNGEAGAAAQLTLTAIRQVLRAAGQIPALKALMARHTGDPSWRNIRPPLLRLSAGQETTLFAAFDACGLKLPAPE